MDAEILEVETKKIFELRGWRRNFFFQNFFLKFYQILNFLHASDAEFNSKNSGANFIPPRPTNLKKPQALTLSILSPGAGQGVP